MSEKQQDLTADDVVTKAGHEGSAEAPETRAQEATVQEATVQESQVPSAAGKIEDEQVEATLGPDPVVTTADPAGTDDRQRLRLRRAPRYLPFGVTGAAIGVIAGVALALSFTASSDYSMQTIAGYFAAILGLVGAVLGLGVAVLFERRRS